MSSKINFKTRRYPLVRFLLDAEYKCFGYRTAGGETVVTDEGYTVERDSDGFATGLKHKTSTTRFAYYARPRDYPSNFLFGLLSFLDGIVSRIRVLLSCLLPIVGVVVILTFLISADDTTILTYIFSVYGAVYGFNILLMILGLVVRKSFRLDEKMDELDKKNGYRPWSEYENE